MNTLSFEIPTFKQTGKLNYKTESKKYISQIEKLLPLKKYHSKTIALLIALIAENNKHIPKHSMNIILEKKENELMIIAQDNGGGFKKSILNSVKKNVSTSNFMTISLSQGLGLPTLLNIAILSCKGQVLIYTSKKNFLWWAASTCSSILFTDHSVSLDNQHYDLIGPFKAYHLDLEGRKAKSSGTLLSIKIPLDNILKSKQFSNLDQIFS